MTESSACTRILVTGASGGLGGALARNYAKTGVNMSLWGRDPTRLEAVASQCRAAGAEVQVQLLDIADVDAALAALAKADSAAPFDLALFASGQGDTRAACDLVEDSRLVARLGTVNFTAPAAMAAALAGRMAQRAKNQNGGGRIVLISSAAAFHALPFAAAYSGTKAGLSRFADALRIGVAPLGVSVTLVSPGFIDTAAGRKVPGPKPMLMTADAVAARIAIAAERRQAHLVLPWPFVALRWLDRVLPRPLRDRLLANLTPSG